ncbi:23S rRNA pseudouridine(2604) synthase RluF [Granulosicoccus antarcticus]|uniref:Pseudouridine synthase n=1 Tax=Granulosicoccus antarcticus IMCC3135 TaxID=1192854 RepID=A0A2Z2NX74_9GAMM|nr:23S rRNA pseudouridine(2604) synthase RluF [Granulosicoccus antarcticus]ASJ74358.1 23S rRNA pseudouridine synthase [Granulosicoccus antarcticus IMCC3135]
MVEKYISSDSSIRINKYICESGLCPRKAADAYVARGVVFINGKQAILGDQVSAGDKVTVDGLPIEPLAPENVLFIALNKPVGVVCTAAKTDKRNIVDFVDHPSRIFPVGRLDKDSQGLIFLTNRCDLVDKILGAGNRHEKEYRVTVNKAITDDFITGISHGVPMLGVITKDCVAVKESDYVFRITLIQGLNRQIRRMCKHYGYSVEKLERFRIMHINLDGLELGERRDLTDDELSVLFHVLETPRR